MKSFHVSHPSLAFATWSRWKVPGDTFRTKRFRSGCRGGIAAPIRVAVLECCDRFVRWASLKYAAPHSGPKVLNVVGERIQTRVSTAFTNMRAIVDGVLGRVREGTPGIVDTVGTTAQNFASANRGLIR